MERVFRATLKHRKIVIAVFLAAFIALALCIPQVKINGNFADYLPAESPSTKAVNVMDEAFDGSVTNARLYVTGIGLPQAREFAGYLEENPAVLDSMWLGTTLDTYQPLEAQDADAVAHWYDGEGYLFQFALISPFRQVNVDPIVDTARALPGADVVAVDGNAITTADTMDKVNSDMANIMLVAVLIVLLIMLLATTSFLHPVIMLVTIGVAIVLNLGSNIVQGSISSVTQLIASVLQLAVSMDYAIVLLTNVQRSQMRISDSFEAMVDAMTRSFPVVLSSAAVTFFGFLSLVLMEFLLGRDMGIVLSKGIVCSFLCVVFLMPCLLYSARHLVARTSHRSLIPPLDGFANVCRRISIPAVIVLCLLFVPSVLANSKGEFTYGADSTIDPASQVAADQELIESSFGEAQTWVILVPEGEWSHEKALVDSLQALPQTTNITSYLTTVSAAMPTEIVPEDSLGQLISNDWSRIIVTFDVEQEGEETFALVEQVRDLCAAEYGDNYYMTGSSVSCYDIAEVTHGDSLKVKLTSILTIGLVLLIMFRSLSIPIALVFTIEVAIFINLAIPYFMGWSTTYIGYLVVDSIQLAAAVDYSIIYAHEYLSWRKRVPAQEAAWQAIKHGAVPIACSSGILIMATLGVYIVASIPMIQELGMLICRGIIIAIVNIFLLLPTLLVLGDKIIQKTSLKLDFFQGDLADAVEAARLRKAEPAVEGAAASVTPDERSFERML